MTYDYRTNEINEKLKKKNTKPTSGGDFLQCNNP